MAKSKTIRVTPNVQKCLGELKAAVKSLPAGDLKKEQKGLWIISLVPLKENVNRSVEEHALARH